MQVSFDALISQINVIMRYGDKEATVKLAFRPEGDVIEKLNALMVNDHAVAVGIVSTENNKTNGEKRAKGRKRKSSRKAEGDAE